MKKSFLLLLLSLIMITGANAQKSLTDIKMVLVKGGDFIMGSDYTDGADERPEHKVKVSDFYMSVYEITFEQFDLFCQATGRPMPNDAGFGRGKNPVMNVSWQDAILYCNWLSSKNELDKVYEISVDSTGYVNIEKVNWKANGFRLPTEAEWEYAAKGGNKDIRQGYIFPGSNVPDSVAWYRRNSGGRPHPVGQLKPNELGIYDLAGNVFEWVWDYYDANYYSKCKSDCTDPHGPETAAKESNSKSNGKLRVYRGGSYLSSKDYIRITRRFKLNETSRGGKVGIRLVRSTTSSGGLETN